MYYFFIQQLAKSYMIIIVQALDSKLQIYEKVLYLIVFSLSIFTGIIDVSF